MIPEWSSEPADGKLPPPEGIRTVPLSRHKAPVWPVWPRREREGGAEREAAGVGEGQGPWDGRALSSTSLQPHTGGPPLDEQMSRRCPSSRRPRPGLSPQPSRFAKQSVGWISASTCPSAGAPYRPQAEEFYAAPPPWHPQFPKVPDKCNLPHE